MVPLKLTSTPVSSHDTEDTTFVSIVKSMEIDDEHEYVWSSPSKFT